MAKFNICKNLPLHDDRLKRNLQLKIEKKTITKFLIESENIVN